MKRIFFLIVLLGCGQPLGNDDDSFAQPDDDDTTADDDDDATAVDDEDTSSSDCPAPEATEQGFDLSTFVVSTFAVSGKGDWWGSPCLQAVLANDRAPNQSPGGRCVSEVGGGVFELSNSYARGRNTDEDDLEVNVALSSYTGPGTYELSPSQRLEVRIGQEDFEWVHWITGDWGGKCTIVIDEGEQTGRASCVGLTGRYGPELGADDEFGVYDVEVSWSCPEVTPP
jgi:hypothetical protein